MYVHACAYNKQNCQFVVITFHCINFDAFLFSSSHEATSSAAGGLGFGKFNMKKKAFAVAKG